MTPPAAAITYGDTEGIIFSVRSSDGDYHTVNYDITDGWLCTCDGCLKGGHFCKHMYQAKRLMELIDSMLLADDHIVFTKDSCCGSV